MGTNNDSVDVSVSQSQASKKLGASKRRIISLLSILAVLVLVLGTFALFTDKLGKLSCKVTYSSRCAINDSVKLLSADKVQELSKQVSKIQQIKNYQKNPDLLYVITNYYLRVGDSKNARKNYDLLIKVYIPEVGFSKKLGNDVLLPRDILDNIEFLEKSAKEVQQNSWGVTSDGKTQMGNN